MTELIYQALALAAVIFMALIGLNIFFVKRLVTKIESVSEKMPLMGAKMTELEREIREMGRDFKDVGNLRERVAVLEAMTKRGAKNDS